MQVVIQPSFGNADAQRHWADTIAREVRFDGDKLRATLTPEQFADLMTMHPSGQARFWGAVSSHDSRMDTLATGDIVLFTGKKHVRGVGEVGVTFRNSRMADSMWTPHGDRGSYHNVYSLRSFEPSLIPYEEIWALPGFNAGDNFMGTRFVTDDRVDYLLEGLGNRTETARVREARAEHDLARALAEAGGATNVIPGEAFNVESTSYDVQARTVLVNRSESLLVNAYAAHLGLAHERTSTPVGLTDLYVPASGGGHELVEAKSSTSRRHIREAVGQLLDYAPHCEAVTSLAVLLPERSEQSAVGYVHRYGIDVVYRTAEGSFERVPAPHEARAAILTLTGHAAALTAPAAGAPEVRTRMPAWQPPATEAVRAATTSVSARAARPNLGGGSGLGR